MTVYVDDMRAKFGRMVKAHKWQRRPIPERFWMKVDRRGKDECWNWLAGRGGPYGTFCVSPQRRVRAHVFAYELTHGVAAKFPQVVLHSCDNTLCCNPQHLSLGTQADNVADMVAKGRQKRGRAKR